MESFVGPPFFGRINCSFRHRRDSFLTLQMDLQDKAGMTIDGWLKHLTVRLPGVVTDAESWYLSYFVVMDARTTPAPLPDLRALGDNDLWEKEKGQQ